MGIKDTMGRLRRSGEFFIPMIISFLITIEPLEKPAL
jgi:hypothetical protein